LAGFQDTGAVIKLNAAIVHDTTDRSIFPLYYIPSTTMNHFELPKWLKGCVQVDGLHPHIEDQMRIFELSNAIVQKSHVKALTVAELLDSFGRQALRQDEAVPSVRLFKVDAEGYDFTLINDMLDYYSSRIGIQELQTQHSGDISVDKPVPRITSQWPCVVFFETRMVDSPQTLTQLATRLGQLGYNNYSDMSKEQRPWEVVDSAIINCQCKLYDFEVVSMFLIFEDEQFQPSIVQERCKNMGHVVN
jgi:hypothetical protein